MWTILLCGCLGGFATVLGKLSFSNDNPLLNQLSIACFESNLFGDVCYYGAWIVRLVSFAAMFACNAMVIGYFLKAMEQNNTVVVTVVSSATNFLTSGILGYAIFGEALSRNWYIGSSLIMIGMCFVSFSQGNIGFSFRANKKVDGK